MGSAPGSGLGRGKTGSAQDTDQEVGRGSRLLAAGRVFHVSRDPEREFSADSCPVDETFEGLSTNDVVVFAGEVRDARNSREMRVALLCEMVARACKAVLRCALRRSAELQGCVVASVAGGFAVDLLNALTGAHPRADVVWQEEVVPSVWARFGERAISSVEAASIRTTLAPCLPYLVRRFCALTGACLTRRALAALDAAPDGFGSSGRR